MNLLIKSALAALAAGLGACGSTEQRNANEVAIPPAKSTTETHWTSGTVKNVSGLQVTISHGPVKSLGWPAMTMAFKAQDAASLGAIKAGDQVQFAFSKLGDESVLTSITKQ